MAIVDVSFKVIGKEIPADHGYALFSALSEIIPAVHNGLDLGIHSIKGKLSGNRMLFLEKNSSLDIRIHSEKIIEILLIAGKTLNLKGNSLTIGVPSVRVLIPSARLFSRLVVIRGFLKPDGFLEAVGRQLDEMGVKGIPSLVTRSGMTEGDSSLDMGSVMTERGVGAGDSVDGKVFNKSKYVRRTLRIRDKEIVGYALRIEQLTAEESLLIQEKGVGGRRKFGCGLFIPVKR